MDARGLLGSRWGRAAWVVVGLMLAIVILHPEISFQNKIYSSADAKAAAAFTSLGKAARAEGEVPLWNPFVFGGMPSYGSLAYLPDVYPVTRPLRAAVDSFGLPPMSWLLFHLLVLSTGVVFYLRSRGVSMAASVAAGLWTLALPKLMAWGVHGHGTKLGTIAWLPWSLWCLERLFVTGRPRVAMLLAAIWAMQLLRHHVQIFYYSALVALVLVAAELVSAWIRKRPARAWLPPTAWTVLAAVLAMAASALIYLPVWEYQAFSIRGAASQGGGAAYDYATNWSLAPSELSTLVWPTAVGYGSGSYVGAMPFNDYPNYIGLALLLLAMLGFWKTRDRWGWAWASVALLTTLLAFGRHGALYDLFYAVAPFFKKFRVPAMILIIQQLAIILLAARGLEELVRLFRSPWRWSSAMALGLAAGGALLFLYGSAGSGALNSQHLSHWMGLRPEMPVAAFDTVLALARADAMRMGVLLLLSAALLTPWARRIPATAIVLGIGILWFVDLWSVGRPIVHPEDHLTRPARSASGITWNPASSMIREQSVVASYVQDTELGRWLRDQEERPRVWPIGHGARARDNELAAQRVVNLGGYHAAKLKRYEELRRRIFDTNPPAVRLVNLLATKWVLLEQEVDAATLDALAGLGMDLAPDPAYVGAGGVVYENRSALPRARLVSDVELEAADGQDGALLDRLAREVTAARRVAVLPSQPTLALGGDLNGATAEVEDLGFDALRVRVKTPANAILVLADIYYPGWEVEVDGTPARLLRADYALRGVEIPAGEHVVEMSFSGGGYATGRRLATISWLLMAVGFLGSLWWERRKPAEVLA